MNQSLLLRFVLMVLCLGIVGPVVYGQATASEQQAQLELMEAQQKLMQAEQARADSLASLSRMRALLAQEMAMAATRRAQVTTFALLIILILVLLLFLFLRYRRRIRTRERELLLQSEREKKEQLEALNRFKSRFFENISHEFRTPLTLIMGQTQQIREELDIPELDHKFDRIYRNGERLLDLVNQVLNLSKLESGNIKLTMTPFDLVPFLKNLLFSFESLAEQNQQQLRFEHDADQVLLLADPKRLERVFYNLLINALKFTSEKGEISLELRETKDKIRIGVKDTGIGIPQEQIPFIFDRFYQAEGGDTHPSPGTGIGLALAKELVELHGGKIWVESELGVGSAFWVELSATKEISSESPFAYQPQLKPLEPRPDRNTVPNFSLSKDRETILIVEDNVDVRSYLRDELLTLGYTVHEAADGKEGLEQASSLQPDLIISDVMMPKMDGLAFAHAIRADVHCSHIPLILLTAKASEANRLEGLQTGADTYLTKPFHREELKIWVNKLIEQRKHLRERFSQAIQIRPEEVSAVPMDQAFLVQLTDTIEAHLSHPQLSVEMLSEEVGMSVSQLNRKLNALIGQSAGKLIRSLRLQRAADLIQQQAGTVSEIAYELGFSSPNNFARAFKKQFGIPPSSYAEAK